MADSHPHLNVIIAPKPHLVTGIMASTYIEQTQSIPSLSTRKPLFTHYIQFKNHISQEPSLLFKCSSWRSSGEGNCRCSHPSAGSALWYGLGTISSALKNLTLKTFQSPLLSPKYTLTLFPFFSLLRSIYIRSIYYLIVQFGEIFHSFLFG